MKNSIKFIYNRHTILFMYTFTIPYKNKLLYPVNINILALYITCIFSNIYQIYITTFIISIHFYFITIYTM